MRRNNQIGLVIVFTLLLCGCVWEDMANCDVSLHIRYDYNEDSRNKILEEVEQLELFVFLEDGRLHKRLSIHPKTDGTSIDLSLEGGTYNLVAWGNLPPATHQEMSYHYDTDSGKLIYQSENLHFQDSMLGLFWGASEAFTIDGNNRNSIDLSLIKNTKHIDVVIIGSAFTNTNCELFADNRNHDNNNIPFDLLNSSPRKEDTTDHIIYRFNTHRLLEADSAKSALKFYGKKTEASDMECIINTSLISLLLKCPDIDDLDRFDHYVIELIFADGFISPMIKVNGWIIVDMPEEL